MAVVFRCVFNIIVYRFFVNSESAYCFVSFRLLRIYCLYRDKTMIQFLFKALRLHESIDVQPETD